MRAWSPADVRREQQEDSAARGEYGAAVTERGTAPHPAMMVARSETASALSIVHEPGRVWNPRRQGSRPVSHGKLRDEDTRAHIARIGLQGKSECMIHRTHTCRERCVGWRRQTATGRPPRPTPGQKRWQLHYVFSHENFSLLSQLRTFSVTIKWALYYTPIK
jgi:hypothetical protein